MINYSLDLRTFDNTDPEARADYYKWLYEKEEVR